MNETTQEAESTMKHTSKQDGYNLFADVVKTYGLQKIVTPIKPMHLALGNREEARRFLHDGLEYYLNLEGKGKELQWLPEYDKIVEWMVDNKSKGLFLYGGCGLGKTVIATRVIPAFLAYITDGRWSYDNIGITDARDLKRYFANNNHLYTRVHIIDDIGTESESVEYGNRRDFFPELMDLAEKKGLLIIATSNLGAEALKSKYEERTMQRLKVCTQPILFDGTSFR